MSPEVSRHHAFYEKRSYMDNELLRELRQRHIVPMRHAGHMALHRAVEAPPVPPLHAVADYLDQMDQDRPAKGEESFQYAREWFAFSYVSYMGNLATKETMLGVANNLSRQLPFIRGNIVWD